MQGQSDRIATAKGLLWQATQQLETMRQLESDDDDRRALSHILCLLDDATEQLQNVEVM